MRSLIVVAVAGLLFVGCGSPSPAPPPKRWSLSGTARSGGTSLSACAHDDRELRLFERQVQPRATFIFRHSACRDRLSNGEARDPE
jgi:hypothetical protein